MITLATLKNSLPSKIDALSHSYTKFFTQYVLDKHTKQELFEVLNIKKTRVYGRKLNLLGEEDNNVQLFSLTHICAAKNF